MKELTKIKRAKGAKKDKFYLDLAIEQREAVLAKFILSLPVREYTRAQLKEIANESLGVYAECDLTQQFLSGLACLNDKKFGVCFTHGLDVVYRK